MRHCRTLGFHHSSVLEPSMPAHSLSLKLKQSQLVVSLEHVCQNDDVLSRFNRPAKRFSWCR